jgi:GT2 family glycosyltransferase
MYKEDVDLAWRLHRLGWRAWYSPTAIAWHGRTSAGPRTERLVDVARANQRVPAWIRGISWRNQRLMQLKNDDFRGYRRDLPRIAQREILSWLFVVGVDPFRMRATIDLVKLLPVTLTKRRYLARRFAQASRHPKRAID